MVSKELYEKIKNIAFDSGAVAFGVGYIDDLRGHFDNLPVSLTEGLINGISIAVKVSDRILAEIEDHPTRLYLHHYRTLNALLDQLAVKIATFIQKEGFDALPIPASQIVDWGAQTAHLSHKMIAVRTGIGWLGRNNLLVHPEYGSSIRLATVLTNMSLLTDSPVEGDCGECRKCIEVCPVSAIGESHKDYNRDACLERLKWFAKTYNIGHYICGICVKACIRK